MPIVKSHLADQHQQMTLINKQLGGFFYSWLKLFDEMVNTCENLLVSSKHRLPAAANACKAAEPG